MECQLARYRLLRAGIPLKEIHDMTMLTIRDLTQADELARHEDAAVLAGALARALNGGG